MRIGVRLLLQHWRGSEKPRIYWSRGNVHRLRLRLRLLLLLLLLHAGRWLRCNRSTIISLWLWRIRRRLHSIRRMRTLIEVLRRYKIVRRGIRVSILVWRRPWVINMII